MSKQSIFRTPAVQRQLEINEATLMPRFLRPTLAGRLWLLFGLLAGGGVIVWLSLWAG